MAAPRWLKLLIGPIPATIYLVPFLMAGALGAGFALIGMVRQQNGPFGIVAAPLLGIIVWVFGAVFGVVALWIASLAPSVELLRESRLRWWTVSGLLIGFASAITWLYSMAHMGRLGPVTWLVWIVLLGGPIIMSIFYAVLLARRQERSNEIR